MEKDSLKPMTPFDELTVPPELQIMKLLLPYTPASNQQMLGILIKFLELQHTVHLFRHATLKTQSQTSNGNPPSFADILDEISPYLPSQGLQMIHTFHEIMNIMELAKTLRETSDSCENSSDNTAKSSPFGTFNPADLMKGMLSPEQQEMFQMYQSMFEQEGEPTHGQMDGTSSSEKYGTEEIRANSDDRRTDCRKVREESCTDYDGADYQCQQTGNSIYPGGSTIDSGDYERGQDTGRTGAN